MKKGFLKRAAAVSLVAGALTFGAAPLATASEAPVEAGLCPTGWYGVWVGFIIPGPHGDIEKTVVACFQA